jgi:DNA-binding transcriptional MerR regulator
MEKPKQSKEVPTFLMSGDVAREVGKSATHVARLVEQGKLLPAAKTTAGYRLFLAEDVARYREERGRR